MIPGLLKKKRRKPAYIRDIDISNTARKSLLYLILIIVLHTLLIGHFENLSIGDALWLTLTTATTVGYGDISATSFAGRTTTVVLIYFGGIFVLANFAGEYFEGRLERKNRMLKGNWEWNMCDHLVIINTPSSGGTNYFVRLITQIRKTNKLKSIPIQLLTRQYATGLPNELRNLGVVHHNGYPDRAENLDAINIKEASHIIVICKDEYNIISDALTFDILHRIRESGVTKATILVECIDDENRSRFIKAGADVVLRPVRAYPEILVRAIAAPGSEIILENLFMHDGDHTRRYEVKIDNLSWGEIVNRLINAGYGTALAYIDQNNEPICNAEPTAIVNARAILIMVREDRIANEEEINQALSA